MSLDPKGLSFPIRFNAGLGHLERRSGEEKIRENLHAIIVTAIRERVMNPTFGSVGYRIVFSNLTDETRALVSDIVYEAVSRFEPRVRVVEISTVEAGEGQIEVRVSYVHLETNEPQSTTVTVNEEQLG